LNRVRICAASRSCSARRHLHDADLHPP
jgi:hypothetical protein